MSDPAGVIEAAAAAELTQSICQCEGEGDFRLCCPPRRSKNSGDGGRGEEVYYVCLHHVEEPGEVLEGVDCVPWQDWGGGLVCV